jgi:hypothetical protein
MKRVKSLVFKGLAQIVCQSQATYLGNAGQKQDTVLMCCLKAGELVCGIAK